MKMRNVLSVVFMPVFYSMVAIAQPKTCNLNSPTLNLRCTVEVSSSSISTGGTGTEANPYTGWDDNLNLIYRASAPSLDRKVRFAPATHGSYIKIHFGPGYYKQTKKVNMNVGWYIHDDGMERNHSLGSGTVIKFEPFEPTVGQPALNATAFESEFQGNQHWVLCKLGRRNNNEHL